MIVPKHQKIIFYTLLVICSVLFFAPIAIAMMMSFMTTGEIMTGQVLPSQINFDHYVRAFELFPLAHFMLNSFIVSATITMGQIVTSSLAAYAFVFLKFKGRNVLFMLVIGTMLIPWEATIIPNFHTIRDLGWVNDFRSLTVPFFAVAFGTFLLRQNFKQIPKELKEASDVAGISDFKFYLTVALPMAKSSLITLAAWAFLTSWNMYLWPLLVTTNDRVRTVQIGLRQTQAGEQLNDWGMVMAAAIMVVIPTLLVLFIGQKHLQKGLTEGAIK
jgi:sn-glycerol 3-phosphate transport system permease protein